MTQARDISKMATTSLGELCVHLNTDGPKIVPRTDGRGYFSPMSGQETVANSGHMPVLLQQPGSDWVILHHSLLC